MDEQRPWHRLFGLSWMDFFRGLPVQVELEKDLSLKQQLLDVVIIRKEAAALPCRLPDGFEDLSAHNLISFKSYQEALDGWALNELVGHYVNYRKQSSPSMQDLLPEADFRLFAVSVRFPQGLAQQVALEPLQEGVYEVRHFTGSMRLVVVHQLPQREHNAMLHLFSAKRDLLQYGKEHYRVRSAETSTLLLQLFETYSLEGSVMPDALEEFAREKIAEIVRKLSAGEPILGLPAADILKKLPAEERLKGVPAEERLKGVPAEERLKGVPAEERLKGLSVDELLAALSPEKREELLRRLKGNDSTSAPER
jgi:hypothetical protein